MKNKKIGLLGLSFYSGNKGCCALSYSFLEVLNRIAIENHEVYELYIFLNGWKAEMMPRIKYNNLRYRMVPILRRKVLNKIINWGIGKCDVIFDFTAGDSFSDIYGLDRFDTRTAIKEKIISKGIPLVLGSQTYGPFISEDAQKRAANVLTNAKAVFSRDSMSSKVVISLTGKEPITTSDIAFLLPYDTEKSITSNRIKVGINPSGLLWNGGYTQDNQFGLSVDYRSYLIQVLKYLCNDGRYDVYLIPHVISADINLVENDCAPCLELKKMYPDVIYTFDFENVGDYSAYLPMDVKSIISEMDVFLGARMHATIAAFSSGVPVIPFSYSRKFEGLYNDFDYHYLISGTKINTDEAISQTISWIENREEINDFISKKCTPKMAENNAYLICKTKEVIASV